VTLGLTDHTLSRILDAPEVLDVVSREQLEALAAVAKPAAAPPQSKPKTGKKFDQPYDMQGLIERNANVLRVNGEPVTDGKGTHWKLTSCPFESDKPDTNPGNASLFLSADGKPGFSCFNDDEKHGIKDLWELLGEKAARPADDEHPNTRDMVAVCEWLDGRFVQIIDRDLVAENRNGNLRTHEKLYEKHLSDVWVELEDAEGNKIRNNDGTVKKLPGGKFWLQFWTGRPKCREVGFFPGNEDRIVDGDYFNLWTPREPLPLDDESVARYRKDIQEHFIPLLNCVYGSPMHPKSIWYLQHHGHALRNPGTKAHAAALTIGQGGRGKTLLCECIGAARAPYARKVGEKKRAIELTFDELAAHFNAYLLNIEYAFVNEILLDGGTVEQMENTIKSIIDRDEFIYTSKGKDGIPLRDRTMIDFTSNKPNALSMRDHALRRRFMGHIIPDDGPRLSPEKYAAIGKWSKTREAHFAMRWYLEVMHQDVMVFTSEMTVPTDPAYGEVIEREDGTRMVIYE
jgi:hypothetical protein